MVEIYDDKGNTIEAFDEDGNPIDVFGKGEVDERVEETKEAEKEKFEEKFEEKKVEHEEAIGKKDEEIEQIKADIKAGEEGDKAKNLTGLRKKLEDTEKAKEAIEGKFESFKKETDEKIATIHSAVSNKKVDDAIVKLTDDKEMQDKVRVHFNRIKPLDTADPVKIEEDFQNRVKEAHILAGGVVGNVVGGVAATTGGYVPAPAGEATHETPEGEVKEMGTQKMGLSDKDFRDHKKAKNA